MIELFAALLLQGTAEAEAPAPRRFDPYLLCVCPDVAGAEEVRFTGYATDAQMILGEDGKSTLPRQATIFRLEKGPKELASPVKVWHFTKAEKCGLSFAYGKRYEIVAVRKGDQIETNWCLMGKPR
ncbi:MAG: hypothetical protein U5J99_00170 [Parvularculaceae bacterium]|nr:hypothetical protein [Parvularculaceae bacterium]